MIGYYLYTSITVVGENYTSGLLFTIYNGECWLFFKRYLTRNYVCCGRKNKEHLEVLNDYHPSFLHDFFIYFGAKATYAL